MTIDEAIKRLPGLEAGMTDKQVKLYDAALRLGIEALKREKGQRAMGLPSPIVLLPGETKE